MTDDQAEATQKLFDDVDRIVPQAQRGADIEAEKGMYEDISWGVLALAKAVQTLRPSTSTTPTEYSQEPDSEKQLEQPKDKPRGLSLIEWELIQHMRSEELSADKLTTYLKNWDHGPSQRLLYQLIREET